jgi:tetratricopeptide (TPR) repeat protein
VDADLYERKSLDNFRKSAEVHTALARCYVYLGADDLAEDEIELARRRYVELGEDFNFFDTRKLFWCQTNGRGWLLTNQGKLKEGEFKFRNTISAAERFDQKRYLSIDDEALVDAYIGLGDILRLQKEYHESEEAYNQGLLVSREFGSLWLKARAEIALAKLFARNDTKHIALMDDARRCLSFMGLNVENIIDPLMKIEEKN